MEIKDQELLNIAKSAIRDKVIERFTTQWSSPLNKMADEVVQNHAGELKEMFEDCLSSITSNRKFKETVKGEFVRKIAKSLVGKLEGTVERAVDKLKNDPTLKARMILAIESIIKESP